MSREADQVASCPGRSASPQRCFKLLGPLGPTSGGHLTSPRPTHPSRPSSRQFTALSVLPGGAPAQVPRSLLGVRMGTRPGGSIVNCALPTSSLGAAPQAVSTANSRKWAEGDRISGVGGRVGCGCARSGGAHFPPDVFSHKLRGTGNKKRARLLRTRPAEPIRLQLRW